MTKRGFIATVCLVLVCFIAANIAMERWRTQLGPIQKLDMIDRARNANVVLLGNSLMEFAVDPQIFDRAARQESRNLTTVNAALRGTAAREHYLLFREAVRNSPIHTVIVGIFDFQCTETYRLRVSEILGSPAFVFDPRIPIQEVERVYEFPLAERLQFRLFRLLPLFAYRSAVWESVARLRAGRGNRPGAENVFEMLFEVSARRLANVPVHFNPPTEKIIQESQARGYRIIFVLMPVSPRHFTASYMQPRWGAYVGSLRKLFEERRCGFIDASGWLPSQSLFMDSVHLSRSGKLLFSPALARASSAELSAMESRWPK